MMSPQSLTVIARAALLSLLAVLGLGNFLPPAVSEELGWPSSLEWRAPCLFLVALLAQASLPAVRRRDITLLAMVFACGMELTLGFGGREPSLARMIAGVAGVAAAWLPGAIDHLRTR